VSALIEGDLVRLRAFDRGDAEAYRGFVNDPEIARRIDRSGRVNPEEHAGWYQALVTSPTAEVFAVEERSSGTFMGLVWLFDIQARHARAEVRIVLGRHHGRGCGTEALRLLADHAFRSRGLTKLWADVFSFNEPAARAFDKAGFVREGLLRADRAFGDGRADIIRFGLVSPSLEA
jgi:RimJ/RimL family protein N-acetyltransferase